MRPARKGPENLIQSVAERVRVAASMRPARKGPENVLRGGHFFCTWIRFNEAGPQGAGKPPTSA